MVRESTAITQGTYDGTGGRSPQWWPSRYGPDDELGAGNELSSERTLKALKVPREGRVIEIAQLLEPGVAAYPPRGFSQIVLAHQSLFQFAPDGSQMTGFEEQVTQTYHIGCHLDGLGHIGIDGRFYNGTHAAEVFTPSGLSKFGIHNVPPWVTRGVCLDIAALEDTDVLPAGYVINVEHLEQSQERQGVEVRAGDAVLLHTCWATHWKNVELYGSDEPGAGWDACHWLTDRRVSCVGADNWAFEVLPSEDPQKAFVGHQHLLAETGTYIIENIKTGELVAGKHSEFLFLMAPNKVKGATASMVSPLVVV